MTDFYVRESVELDGYVSDQNVIIRKRDLQYISRLKYKEETFRPIRSLDWYPATNSYYQYTEDVDAFNRVNHVLNLNPSFDSVVTLCEEECDGRCRGKCNLDPYSERGAQLQYLYSKPISFLIIGKPGVGEQELGKLLAEHWNCVYIDPETLINEEIESGSRPGQCMEYNLRCGRAIGVDVILRLVDKRVKTKSATHRGFVICGFPLIPNDLYEEDPVSSESAVFNVHDIFEEIFETTLEIGIPPVKNVSKTSKLDKYDESLNEEVEEEQALEEESPSRPIAVPKQDDVPLDIGSTAEKICVPDEIGINYEDQINFIFNLFSSPFFVIYIMCQNADVVSKHNSYRFDVNSSQVINLQKEHFDKIILTLFSRQPEVSAEEIPEDFLTLPRGGGRDVSQFPNLVHINRDFPANVRSQLQRYRYEVLPLLERSVLFQDPQYILKVDGRTSPERMLNAIKMKLRIMPLQKVILPQKFAVPSEMPGGEGGEADAGDDFDVDGLSIEECFENFQKKQVASPMFKWSWSDWGSKCPVSMKKGIYVDGNPKYAVHFMNKIFFLSDEDAWLEFYRNPRPFLVPPYPKPSCRIFVIGPGCSGKTAVAKCLAYLLNGNVLCPIKLQYEFIQQKKLDFLEKTRSAALTEGILLLNEQRKAEYDIELEKKKSEIEKRIECEKELLQKHLNYLRWAQKSEIGKRIESVKEVMQEDINYLSLEIERSSIPLETIEEEFSITMSLDEMQQLFTMYNLPYFGDVDACENLLNEPDRLHEYLPPGFRLYDVPKPEPAAVFDQFVIDYANKTVEKAHFDECKMTIENLAEMFVDAIKCVEYNCEAQGNNKGGWVIDGMLPDPELFQVLYPDYMADDIYLLMDRQHEFLLSRYETIGLNQFREFRRFFTDIGKHDAAWRSPSLRSTDSYRLSMALDVVSSVLDEDNFPYEKKIGEGEEEKEEAYFSKHPRRAAVEKYKISLNKFDEEWERVNSVLVDLNISPVIINVANKSLEELLEEIVKDIEDRYRQLATLFTPDDRDQELEDFGLPQVQEEEMGEESEEKEETENIFLQNRRFGDTHQYCPVTFHKYWVLWKGKEEFAARFESKLYLLCNTEAMTAFIEDPRKYLLRSGPPPMFPPPRICVIGPSQSGKTSVAKSLSKNFGLCYISYTQLIKDYIAPGSSLPLEELLKSDETYENVENIDENAESSTEENADENIELVRQYVTSDMPLPEEFLNKLLHPIWFEDPIKTFGFVLDGFPMRPSDVDYMEKHGTIPDDIIELSISDIDLINRSVIKLLEQWQIDLIAKQEEKDRQNGEVILEWQLEREARLRKLLDLKREERYVEKMREKENGVPESDRRLDDIVDPSAETNRSIEPAKSEVSYDSVAQEADYREVMIALDEELPQPEFYDEWETVEEAMESFTSQLQATYTAEMEIIKLLREYCDVEQIPWSAVDGNLSEDKVLAQACRVIDEHKFRNDSMFERCYDIAVELAEKLLSSGFYFLSKFGRSCPVQYFERINAIHMFLPSEQKFLCFPVIHRQYIYFIAGRESHIKFKEDPLKYTSQDDVNFPIVPFRVAIIGPPKCGKTDLAERFKRDLCLQYVSVGRAGRYVLKYLEYSELAKNIEVVLRNGWEMTSEMAMRCVEAMAFDSRGVAQGCVFDGFPNSIEEVRHLAEIGLVPHLVIDLQANLDEIHSCLASDTGKRNLPVFSQRLIDHRYNEWLLDAGKYRSWLDKEYQILAKISIKPSKWRVWTSAYDLASAVFFEVKHYYKNYSRDLVLRLSYMQVTPMEFIERRSGYKHYCPCCLLYYNKLVDGGDPPDRTGLVQFRKYFYWICHEHIKEFTDNPEMFLSPYNKRMLPADLPIRFYLTESTNLYEDGFCIICYWVNQPKRVLNEGIISLAVLYRDKVYLFDCEAHLKKFMAEPHKFYSKTISFKDAIRYPSLQYGQLPTLGLLEQYEAMQVVKAVTNTSILRPLVPGLSGSVSASLNIGLFLKIHNPRTPTTYLDLYENAQKTLIARRNRLVRHLVKMKEHINPYIYYEEPVPPFKFDFIQEMASPDSSTSSEVGVVIEELRNKLQ